MTSRQLAEFVAKLVSRCLYDKDFPTWFRLWEEHGFHVTPVHYYSPIPDSQHLNPDIWDRPSELPGIDLNSTMQLYLLHEVFPRFRSEYERIPVDSSRRRIRFLSPQWPFPRHRSTDCLLHSAPFQAAPYRRSGRRLLHFTFGASVEKQWQHRAFHH